MLKGAEQGLPTKWWCQPLGAFGNGGSQRWGAPGIQGLGPGMLNTPQCAQPSPTTKQHQHRMPRASAFEKHWFRLKYEHT